MGRTKGVALIGYLFNSLWGRLGRFSKPPPQLGHTLRNIFLTQVRQNVHSKLQIIASLLPFGNGLAQCSQTGRISNMGVMLIGL